MRALQRLLSLSCVLWWQEALPSLLSTPSAGTSGTWHDWAGTASHVLVDAECTHDGSVKHVLKYERWGWDTFQRRVLDPERLTSLAALQRRLIHQGFRLLAVGGMLVYSTCSLMQAQNEDVVAWLLEEEPSAVLVDVPFAVEWETAVGIGNGIDSETSGGDDRGSGGGSGSGAGGGSFSDSDSGHRRGRAHGNVAVPWIPGRLPGTLKFEPCRSRTSGLFVARIMKR